MALGLMATGCAQPRGPAGTPLEQAWETPATVSPTAAPVLPEPVAPVTATEPAFDPPREPPDAVIALVNGRPILRDRLITMLIETRGLALLEQMILLAAAQRRAEEMGLEVTADDVQAAHEEALKQIAQPIGGEGLPLDRPAAEKLLREFLSAKNLSPVEWELRMKQRAFLRRVAAAEVEKMTVTDAMLREEYALAYGERVQIRHIQVSSLAAVERVRAALAREDFAAVARQMSENQITGAGGGLLPPFTRNDGSVPPLIRETAFDLKPGEVSAAVQQDNWYHLIRLERRFPASGVRFENVDRDALRKRLLDRLTRQRQDALEEELFRSARVDIRDETLRRQFAEKYRRW